MDGTCGNGAEEEKAKGQQGGKSFGCWNGCASGLGCGVDLVFGRHGYVFFPALGGSGEMYVVRGTILVVTREAVVCFVCCLLFVFCF